MTRLRLWLARMVLPSGRIIIKSPRGTSSSRELGLCNYVAVKAWMDMNDEMHERVHNEFFNDELD